MGFFITKLENIKLNEYIGSQTMYSCADNGAFNSAVSRNMEDRANKDERIFAIIDKNGIDNFITVLKSGVCKGRDVEKFVKIIEEKYKDGFMMRG